MPLSDYSLDKFVAPKLSQLNEWAVRDLRGCVREYGCWVDNFILNSIFRVGIPRGRRQLMLYFLRKTDGALQEYEEARTFLGRYVAASRPSLSHYFHALRHFETAMMLAWQACDAMNMVMEQDGGRASYKGGDGSAYDRLRRIQNIVKHAAEKLLCGRLSPEPSVPVWLVNEGVESSDCSLTFDELAQLLTQLGAVAEEVSNPSPQRPGKTANP